MVSMGILWSRPRKGRIGQALTGKLFKQCVYLVRANTVAIALLLFCPDFFVLSNGALSFFLNRITMQRRLYFRRQASDLF